MVHEPGLVPGPRICGLFQLNGALVTDGPCLGLLGIPRVPDDSSHPVPTIGKPCWFPSLVRATFYRFQPILHPTTGGEKAGKSGANGRGWRRGRGN